MRYFLVTIILLALGVGYYWWTSVTTPTNEDKTDVVSTTTTQSQNPTPETETTTKLDHQVYTNDTWGIKFNYPNDWEVLANTFKAGSSLFNVIIQPESNESLPRPVFIIITPSDWGKTMIKKYHENEITDSELKTAGLEYFNFESSDMGIPIQTYFIPINNTYWINISGKKGYETELNQVLDSLEITPVEINNIE
ncbi:MAG: hypothetical protein R3B60_00835 [Candidatus Paceibacterota bacterium]